MVWGCGLSLDEGTVWEHPGRKQGRQKKRKKMRARGAGEGGGWRAHSSCDPGFAKQPHHLAPS